MQYICKQCKKTYTKWVGKCDNCGAWNSLEEIESNLNYNYRKIQKDIKYTNTQTIIKKLSQISETKDSLTTEIYTNISEIDNLVGGKFIAGQYILLAGSPGIGKSTLCLQILNSFYLQNKKILYLAGEESLIQIKNRIDRLGIKIDDVDFVETRDVYQLINILEQNVYDVFFVDSIQTLYSPNINSVPGSVSQVCECANLIMEIIKAKNILTFIIGHITKSGDIAGPMYLEHMVDTILLFEGDRKSEARYLKVIKNRFGPTDELGIFRMTNKGLVSIKNTLDLIDSSSFDIKSPGIVFVMTAEGNRPIPLEVQALASRTFFSNPRRTASNFDINRLYIILALLEKKMHIAINEYDIFINIVGGIKYDDPGIDLGVLMSIYSSLKDFVVSRNKIFFGEVGLSGEIKKVYIEDKRIKESNLLGFTEFFCSQTHKTVEKLIKDVFNRS